MLRRVSLALALVAVVAGVLAWPRHLISRTSDTNDFVNFESGHVRPAVLTPSGDRLLVINTPDARLSVFDLTGVAPVRIAEIPVGIEPVSVRALDDSTAWVVNLVSDDISIVNLNTLHTRASLRVGDEPNDVEFAGTPVRAYVSVSEENRIKVYDPVTLALETTIEIPASYPRSLAKTANGSHVYVASLHGNNNTTILTPEEVADSIPDDPDYPRYTPNKLGHLAPKVAAVVRKFGADWTDEYGKLWNSKVSYAPVDHDVIEISTTSQTVTRTFSASGSTNFALAVSPADGRIGVANTDARNQLRFEPKLSGYVTETQVGWITQAGTFTRRVINPHINYTFTPGPQSDADSALGLLSGIAFAASGNRAYVTAMANDRIGVLNPAGGAASTVRGRIPTLEGPSGVVVDDARGRLYVVGRFRNQLQTLSITTFAELDLQRIGFDPTPDMLVHGRRFFYAGSTSGHGEQACASCHIFGDTDHLAWDLGDPFGPYLANMAPLDGFDPQKGPMVTQSLRGLNGNTPLHWRGDRPDLAAFNGAIAGLLGRATPLPDSQMAAMSEFMNTIVYPPNPYGNLDRSLPDAPPGVPSAERGRVLFETSLFDTSGGTPVACSSCHAGTAVGPGTNNLMVPNETIFDPQDLKVPQLRNLYKKLGFSRAPGATPLRSTGFSHNGVEPTIGSFLGRAEFAFDPDTSISGPEKRDLEAYLIAFDTGMAPAVGHQLSFDGNANPGALATLAVLQTRTAANDCDLIATGIAGGTRHGWLYQGGDQWKIDQASIPNVSTTTLLDNAGLGTELTITAVPKGAGIRMALDRDRDTYLDTDEILAGFPPDDPDLNPGVVGSPVSANTAFGLRSVRPNPSSGPVEIVFSLSRPEPVQLVVYDVFGRQVRSLTDARTLAAGPHAVSWDGRRDDGGQTGAGVYFARLRTATGTLSRSLVRIR
ncbi:MAG: hypothetical protein HOP12_09345 [Candidatus Eisenbacteria bacterium]|uniref:Cytochrome c domain-containing protein n=1 Tax=Eiseniibacteriota bacterium TaxID=2212470 RepID=A0A849SSK6_UNCEI|nr:hypothetical protein [Candidatus Eisenbacteria bacterium]